MSVLKEFIVKITGKQDVDVAAAKAAGATEGFVGKAMGALKGLGGLLGGLALGAFFKKAVEEALEGQAGIERLGEAVTNAGADFGAMQPQISATVDRLAEFTTFTDDELRAALTNMVTATGDVDTSLGNLGLVTDLAAAKQIPLEQASQAVAQAMNGNEKALAKLIGPMKEGADVFDVLRSRVGGTAEALGGKLSAVIPQVTKQFGEILEAVGNVILGNENLAGGTQGLVSALATTAQWIEANADAAQPLIQALVDVGRNIWEAVVPAFEALAPIAKYVLFSLSFSLENASLAVRFFGGSFQGAMGVVAEGLGWLASKGGKILRAFGFDVAEDAGANLSAWGAKMITNAEASLTKTATAIKAHVTDTVALFSGGEAEATAATERGTSARVAAHARAADRITKTEKKELEERSKAQEKAWDQLGKDLDKVTTAIEKAVGQIATDAAKAGDALLDKLGPVLRTSVQATADELATLWQQAQLDPRVLADYGRYQGALALLQSSARALVDAQEASRAVEHGLPPEAAVQRLDRAIAGLREQARLLRVQIGDSEQVRQLEDQIADLGDRRKQIQDAITTGKGTERRATEEVTQKTEQLFGRVADVARAALDFGLAMGKVDDETAAVLTSVINIGTAIGRLSAGDLSAIPGLLGGLSNIVSRLMNGDEARKRLLSDNSKQLERLRTEGIAGIGLGGGAIDAIRTGLTNGLIGSPGGLLDTKFGVPALLDGLVKAGASITQLDDLAKQLGIGIRDKDGNFVFAALRQLLATLNGLGTGPGSGTSSQLGALRDRLRVTGATDADTARALASFYGERSPILRSLDTSDPTAAYGFLLDLLSKLDSNRIDLKDLGSLSQREFREGLLELLGLTRGLGNAAAGSTSSLTLPGGVPTGGVLPPGSIAPGDVSVGGVTGDVIKQLVPTATALAATVTELRSLATEGVALASRHLQVAERALDLATAQSTFVRTAAEATTATVQQLERLNTQLAGGVTDLLDRRVAERRVLQEAAVAPPPRF